MKESSPQKIRSSSSSLNGDGEGKQQQQSFSRIINSSATSRNLASSSRLSLSLQRKKQQEVGDNLEIELSHINNLDLWRINTQEKLRNQMKFERKSNNFTSVISERKTEPNIKMDIINNIMQSGNNNSINFREQAVNEASKAKRKEHLKQQGKSSSIHNLDFFKNDNNKKVVNQIITNKLRSIYNAEKKLDYTRLCIEQPKMENAFKNFRSLGNSASSASFNLFELTQKVLSDQAHPHKIFDFTDELKRIESEKLDFINVERKVLQKINQLHYNISLIKENKKQLRSLLFDLETKLLLFNPKVIEIKYHKLESNLVLGYFQERKRGDTSKLSFIQIKEKLTFDDIFNGYQEKLKEAKSKEIEEYSNTKNQISQQCDLLRQQLERLKKTSHKAKENGIKCKMQLRDMYIDLLTNRMHIFLESHNVSWISRGFVIIGEEFPAYKLPRYIDGYSIDYILNAGQIHYEIYNLEDRKPQIMSRYNQDTETTTQILKEIAERLNKLPLLQEKSNDNKNFSSQSPAETQALYLGTRISFLIPDQYDLENNAYSTGVQSIDKTESGNNLEDFHLHYQLIRQPTAIQKLFSSNNLISTDQKLLFQEDTVDRRPDYSAIEKKVKELKLKLIQLKRVEILRLIDQVTSKALKEEAFKDSLLILFGQKEQDKILVDYYTQHKRFEALQQQKKKKQALAQAKDPHKVSESFMNEIKQAMPSPRNLTQSQQRSFSNPTLPSPSSASHHFQPNYFPKQLSVKFNMSQTQISNIFTNSTLPSQMEKYKK